MYPCIYVSLYPCIYVSMYLGNIYHSNRTCRARMAAERRAFSPTVPPLFRVTFTICKLTLSWTISARAHNPRGPMPLEQRLRDVREVLCLRKGISAIMPVSPRALEDRDRVRNVGGEEVEDCTSAEAARAAASAVAPAEPHSMEPSCKHCNCLNRNR